MSTTLSEARLIHWAFCDAHPDVLSLNRLKSGLWSVRLKDGTPWPPAAHGLTPEQAYEQALVNRVVRALEKA
jgi:hypothetical protein